ncbi:MAG: PKD domain-containing protein [Ferruginibacter sp.]
MKRKQAGIRIVSTFLFFFSLLTLSSISSQGNPGLPDAPPSVIVPAGPVTFCSGGNLSVSGAPGGSTYQWLQGTTNISGATGSTYFVTASGTYTCIVITGAVRDTLTAVVVTVNSISLTAASTSVCNGSSTTLTASGITTGTYNWINPASGSGATAVVTPSGASTTYSVAGVVNGCNDTATVTVSVKPKPNAAFNYSPSSGCPRRRRKIQFNNTSSPNGSGALSYQWNFGDPNSGSNNTSTSQNPDHSFVGSGFGTSGTFTVTMIATAANGCSDTAQQIISIGTFPDATLSSSASVTTFNGEPFFSICTSDPSSSIDFFNTSTTTATNTNYQIIWGDATPNYSDPTFSVPVSHSYSAGTYVLTFIVSAGSCNDTTDYNVFVGSNPVVGLGNPGGTGICTGNALTFPISYVNASGVTNTPGTIYTITFNDGSAPVVFTHPATGLPQANITHVFDSTSCGTVSSNGTINYNNSFSASISASNPCQSSSAGVVPIYVSQRPDADFTVNPGDTVCQNSTVTFTNTSNMGNTVSSGQPLGNCTMGKFVWKITPATGWTLVSGTLGNDFNTNNPNPWISGTSPLQISFNTPGTYRIKIKVGGNTTCGIDSLERVICVTEIPTAAFTLDNQTGCAPLRVNASGSTNAATCGQNAYQWTVTYAATNGCQPATSNYTYVDGTNANSQNPHFNFINPGVYTIQLQTIAPAASCSSTVVTQQVTVKGKPVLTLGGIPTDICQGQSINPSVTATCYIDAATTYSWTFPSGSPASSGNQAPGTITYSTTGTFNIGLAVTNECGVTNASATIPVNPTPVISGPANVCVGSTITLAGSGTAATGNPWTSSNTSIATVSSTGVVTGISQGTVTITFTNSSNCTDDATVTVNALPVITGPSVVCVGTSITLTGSASPSATTPWTSSNTGVATISNTGVVTGVSSGTTTITYTNSNGCIRTTTVSVSAIPVINGSLINPTACATNTGSITITGLIPNTTGYTLSYSYGGTPQAPINFNTGAGVTTYTIPNLPSGSYTNIIVTLNGCPSNALSFSLVDPSAPPAPVLAASTPICSGQTLSLSVSSPVAGTTYTWSGPNSYSGTGISISIPNATTAAGGNYLVTATLSGCTSPATTVTATVNPTPAAPVATTPVNFCQNATATALTATAAINNTLYWYTVPNGGTGSTTAPTPPTTTVGTTLYYVSQQTAQNCEGPRTPISVVINPTPAISGQTATICSGQAFSVAPSGSGVPAGTTYTWTAPIIAPAGAVTNGSAQPTSQTVISQVLINTTNAPATATYTITAAVGTCSSTFTVTVTVNPNPVVNVNGGTICNGQSTTLTATGADTYTWNPVTGLNAGTGNTVTANPTSSTTYTVIGTITATGCKDTVTSTVTVNQLPLAPGVADVTYCEGDNATPLTATASAGHTLNWYNSANVLLPGPPTPSTAAPGTTTYFVSQTITSTTCEGPKATILVTVKPKITVSPQVDTICSSQTFTVTPTGAGIPAGTTYSWSAPVVTGGLTGGAAGTNASNISGTLSNPTAQIQTATYTVTPTANNCPGNNFTVTIYVNPAPQVTFSPGNQSICSGQNSNTVTISSTTTGVNIPWVSQSPAGITGATASGNNTIPVQTLTNNTASPLTVTYAAVAITSGSNGCPGDTSRYLITVNPKPVVPAQSTSVCSHDPVRFVPVNNPPVTIIPTGTTYTWTFTDNPNVTGETAQATATDTVRQTLVNLTNIPQNVIYTVTPTSGAQGNCPGSPFQLTVTVNPSPEIPALNDTICSGTSFSLAPVNGNPTSSVIVPAGTTYSWPAPVMPTGVSGAVAGSNAPNISGTLVNNTFAPVTIVYVVTPVSGAAGNCPGQPFNVSITINPLAAVSNNPLNQSVCNGGTSTAVNWTSATAGASYSWTVVSSGSVTGFLPAGSGATLGAMTLTNNGIAQDSVVYAVSSTASACAAPATNYTIYVNPDARAAFSFPQDTACWPYPINISNTSPLSPGNPNIPNGSYNWYSINAAGVSTLLGTGSTFPGYTIANPSDSIKIKMVAISAFGCRNDSVTHTFFTKPQPQALFSLSNHDSCGPLVVSFTNQTNLIDTFSYHWDFGNGQTSTLQNPAPVTFLSSPLFVDTTYYITLQAFNECDTSVHLDSVIVRANPKARFSVSSTSGCSPFTIQINNTSLGNAYEYYWDFGNGDTDTTFTTGTFSYTYYTNVVDTFNLMLIAQNQCGRDTLVIDIRVAPNIIRPGITIGSSGLFGCVSHLATFVNSTTGATSFTWDFGDGSPLVTTNVSQVNVPHLYTTPGVFTVTINMTNGCSDSLVTREITVYPRPDALFNPSQNIYCQGDTVRVINNSTDANSYQWDFGDGFITSGFQPGHVYAAPGTYTILLTAERTNPGGVVCSDTISRSVTILSKPDSTILANISGLNCTPYTINASAPGWTNETINWYVYDTTLPVYPVIISGPSMTYTFNNEGTFEVHMVIENAAGCRDSSRRVFRVYKNPVAGFTPLNLVSCNLDTTISYVNTSYANAYTPLTYQWYVDGTLQATSGNFTHQYLTPVSTPLPRTYTTSLIATNSVGCRDTAQGTVQINPLPKSIFNIINPNDCIPFVANITNTSTYTDNYAWYLNGVQVSTDPNPVINITQANTNYTIMLIATNSYGCRPDTSSVSFRSRVMPIARFRLNDTLGCSSQLNIVTTNQSQNATSYSWDWGDASPNSNLPNPTHLYTALGTYRITLTASDGTCQDTTSKVVVVAQKPIVDFSADNPRTCDTAAVHFTNLTTFADSYQWIFSNGQTSTEISPTVIFPPSNSLYTVQLIAYNTIGCKDSLTKANYIRSIIPPAADFSIEPSATISIPNYTFSFVNITANSALYKYAWFLGDGSFRNTRDVLNYQYADTGSYPVKLIVLDTSTNCLDTVIKIARIEGYPGFLYVPNAFYPNSIQNQFRSFKPLGKGLAEYELQIFDSWGKLLFRTTRLDAGGSPVDGWDGMFNGKPMPQDAYAWKIKAKFRNGQMWSGMVYDQNEKGAPGHTFGTVTLFR